MQGIRRKRGCEKTEEDCSDGDVYYCMERKISQDQPCRFDVVSVLGNSTEHIKTRLEYEEKGKGQPHELREDGGVPYFIFKNLEETGLVRHGFSTRLGGVSEGYLASMNLSFTRGDRERECT